MQTLANKDFVKLIVSCNNTKCSYNIVTLKNKLSIKPWYSLKNQWCKVNTSSLDEWVITSKILQKEAFLYVDQKKHIKIYTWPKFAAHNKRILPFFNELLAEAERNPINPSWRQSNIFSSTLLQHSGEPSLLLKWIHSDAQHFSNCNLWDWLLSFTKSK